MTETNPSSKEMETAIHFAVEVKKLAKWIKENTENEEQYQAMLTGALNGITLTNAIITNEAPVYRKDLASIIDIVNLNL